MKEFWKQEWKHAEKIGYVHYAKACKEQYRLEVLKELEISYIQYIEKLKQYPSINLN